jgi:hypothetical protein
MEMKKTRTAGKTTNKLKQQIFDQAWHITYELATGVHTYSACDCGRSQTRTGVCWLCQVERIVGLWRSRRQPGDPTPLEMELIAWQRGAKDAAGIASALYNSSSNHPYDLGDCILAKLNQLPSKKIRPNNKRRSAT